MGLHQVKQRDAAAVTGAIQFARENFWNDGAEGETVHLLCDELELARLRLAAVQGLLDELRSDSITGYQSSALFADALAEALRKGVP